MPIYGAYETSGMIEESPAAIVYLDAMTFIFSIEGQNEVSAPAEALFKTLRNRPGAGATSELTLAEVLVGSRRSQSLAIKRGYLDLIIWSKFLDLVPISREILYHSADLRFEHKESHGRKLKLPDAIHLATAVRKRCRYFVSGDKAIVPPVGMEKIIPDANGLSEIEKALA